MPPVSEMSTLSAVRVAPFSAMLALEVTVTACVTVSEPGAYTMTMPCDAAKLLINTSELMSGRVVPTSTQTLSAGPGTAWVLQFCAVVQLLLAPAPVHDTVHVVVASAEFADATT